MGLKRKNSSSALDALRAPQRAPEPPENVSDIKSLIERRRRQIMVHSEIYYTMNESIIDDHTFDLWCKELADLQATYPQIAQEAVFAAEYKDFDGSTGYHLCGHVWAYVRGRELLDYHKARRKSA